MGCIGCLLVAFHAIDEACGEHDVDVFLPKILGAVEVAA